MAHEQLHVKYRLMSRAAANKEPTHVGDALAEASQAQKEKIDEFLQCHIFHRATTIPELYIHNTWYLIDVQ